jgi:hypothetical protein
LAAGASFRTRGVGARRAPAAGAAGDEGGGGAGVCLTDASGREGLNASRARRIKPGRFGAGAGAGTGGGDAVRGAGGASLRAIVR